MCSSFQSFEGFLRILIIVSHAEFCLCFAYLWIFTFFCISKETNFLRITTSRHFINFESFICCYWVKVFVFTRNCQTSQFFFAHDSLTKVLMKLGSESPIFIYNGVQIGSIIQWLKKTNTGAADLYYRHYFLLISWYYLIFKTHFIMYFRNLGLFNIKHAIYTYIYIYIYIYIHIVHQKSIYKHTYI